MPAASDSGFSLHNLDSLAIPVLVSVPHAGRNYPDDVFANLRLPPSSLLRLEDRYADLLAREAIVQSVPTIIAHKARAWIDLNRNERDIDIAMVSGLDGRDYPTPGIKQRGGLGLIPRRLSGEGDIWKRPIAVAEVEYRISHYHRPYHAAIADTLARMRDQFGIAILLDLHSMPPISATGSETSPQFVVGDRFGRSASALYSHVVLSVARRRGFVIALNYPYSGDHILRHHGAAERNIHALQLEVDRTLYLDSGLREPGSGLAAISGLVLEMVGALADQAQGSENLVAAE